MNIKKLMEMQTALDRHIERKHGLEAEDLFDKKILALLVEAGELANETRSFKFWSKKPSSEREIILEEFVDGIHFILSLGIECGFYPRAEIISGAEPTVTNQFLTVFNSISSFQKSRSEADFHAMFHSYLQLGNMLGFTEVDIEEAYFKKNEVNYERQQTGY
ncbi:dUTPase [Neobacillus notoginsengisoli]|uniref:dUTPase n=1 Tax=Neobacillus notoginsengisoli TaxID=1578198 RepID=A0A417YU65_9BACI|nr:dUTP diphosphatase [Neobacillus notoginsengisoli]RHW40699.1 dUTPase [Neobacillus notoginsengisoli]